MQKKIVIVGGGYVGFEMAKALEHCAQVTLIEQREAFVHPPAAIRALLDQSLLEDIILPYDKLLVNGTVLRARVASVQDDAVTLSSGDKVAADYILIATGSSYAAPFKPEGETIDNFVKASNQVSKKLAAANSVAIIGAGAVGTELAGEIAAAQPGKKITLVSSHSSLFPSYHPKLGARLQARLEASGVTVKLGQRAINLRQTDQPYLGSVTLTDGSQIDADLIFPVIGSTPQTSIITNLPGIALDDLGRIKTDPWLRPSDYPNVFIAGDIASVGDGMTIVAIARQNPWLVKLFKTLLAGKSAETLKPYKPWAKAPILLPLGPHYGASWIFMVLGDFVTRSMKGKEIFVPKYKKAFGYWKNTLPSFSERR